MKSFCMKIHKSKPTEDSIQYSFLKNLSRIYLWRIGERKAKKYGFDKNYGICDNLPTWETYLQTDVFPKWEHFSGNVLYPVPSLIDGVESGEMFHRKGSKWKGKYGKMRLNLLVFSIKYLAKELDLEID